MKIVEKPSRPMRNDAVERTPFDDGELYDVIFKDFRYDLDFYLDLAKDAQGPVLEVGCGTGRIMLPCLHAGVDIDGLDLFPSMLETLRRKAQALGFDPNLHQADMRTFSLPRIYSLIIIPFNAFVHNLTTEDQLKTLTACLRHLDKGGGLVFNIFFPGFEMLSGPEKTPVLEMEVAHPKTGLPVRMFDTRILDRVEQIQYSEVEIQELNADGQVKASHRSKTTIRWIFKPEMELLLRLAGFSRWQIFGGFDRRPLTRDDEPMIVFAWRD